MRAFWACVPKAPSVAWPLVLWGALAHLGGFCQMLLILETSVLPGDCCRALVLSAAGGRALWPWCGPPASSVVAGACCRGKVLADLSQSVACQGVVRA